MDMASDDYMYSRSTENIPGEWIFPTLCLDPLACLRFSLFLFYFFITVAFQLEFPTSSFATPVIAHILSQYSSICLIWLQCHTLAPLFPFASSPFVLVLHLHVLPLVSFSTYRWLLIPPFPSLSFPFPLLVFYASINIWFCCLSGSTTLRRVQGLLQLVIVLVDLQNYL